MHPTGKDGMALNWLREQRYIREERISDNAFREVVTKAGHAALMNNADPASSTKRRTVWGVYARHNGKPAGFCGYYRTKAEAHKARPYDSRVKRETMSAQHWAWWEASGFKARTGWSEPVATPASNLAEAP